MSVQKGYEIYKRGLLIKALRNERYALQNCVRELLPSSRVKGCMRYRIDSKQGVGVKYHPVRKQASYSNIQSCGWGWGCPICSAKISEHKKKDLRKLKDKHLENGGSIYLLTLTNRHHHGDDLKELVEQQAKATAMLWADNKTKNSLNSMGLIGKIRAYEITYSDNNGFHPHFHYLLFFEKRINMQNVERMIGRKWIDVCVKKGMKKPTMKHGCDLRNGKKAVEYISKFGTDSEMTKEGYEFAKKMVAKKNDIKKYSWGVEDEMTKSMIKKGRGSKSLSMFDLLRLYREGDKEKGALFVQFTIAFHRKTQLKWSDGLRYAILGDEEELTDKEIVAEQENDIIPEFELVLLEWSVVNRYKKRDEVLRCVEDDKEFNTNSATELITELLGRYNDDLIYNSFKYNSA